MCDFLARKGNRSEVAVPLTAQVEFRSWVCCAGTQQESPGTSGGAGGRTPLSQRMSPQLARPSLWRKNSELQGPAWLCGFLSRKVTGGREVHASLSVSGRADPEAVLMGVCIGDL